MVATMITAMIVASKIITAVTGTPTTHRGLPSMEYIKTSCNNYYDFSLLLVPWG